MEIKEICPCVNLNCPNHGKCENCTSRHLKRGYLNYCGFQTILPALQEAIEASPESTSAQKLADLVEKTQAAYARHMDKHGLTREGNDALLKKMADFSDY